MHDPEVVEWDVLGLGAVTVDDLLYVEEYPAADSKVRVTNRRRAAGGLCGTALVAAARQGARTAFSGVLGDDELSRFTKEQLAQESIDCSPILFHEAARPRHSTIIVAQQTGTRTIFSDDNGAQELPDEAITAQLITRAKVLFIDHTVPHSGIAAARIAREHNIPVVADIERLNVPRVDELLASIDHLIVGLKCGRAITNQEAPEDIIKVLCQSHEVAVVTHGEHGCWFAERGGKVLYQPAFPVEVVDTTGCGDVFHGAYAVALARGNDLQTRIKIATACAALKATQPGGRKGIPNQTQLRQFLQHSAN
jgi:sulfofructose kinase